MLSDKKAYPTRRDNINYDSSHIELYSHTLVGMMMKISTMMKKKIMILMSVAMMIIVIMIIIMILHWQYNTHLSSHKSHKF